MTPVQLPEVPEWSGDFMTESEFREAARAYATEAVMAERARFLALAEGWRKTSPYMHSCCHEVAREIADDIAELATPSEPNSDR